MNPFSPLLDRVVRAIYVDAEDQSAIRFDIGWSDKAFIGTYADCCSETWFADVVGVQNLIDGQVIGIAILELPTPEDGRSRQESDEAYGIRLTTKKGDCDIVYRNSSNGYYGGSAEPMSNEEGEKRSWLKLTEDWAA